MYNDIFKLKYVKIKNRYGASQNVYLDKQDKEVIEEFRTIQVNSKKFINYFLINIRDKNILQRLEKLKIPLPNKIIFNQYEQQLFYILEKPLNLSNFKIKNYYEAIYSSLLKVLKVEKNNDNLYLKNYFNEKLYEVKEIGHKPYLLKDFRHLIVKEHRLTFKQNGYSSINNLIFNFLNIYCLKNSYLVLKEGRNVIEKKGFEIARELISQNKFTKEEFTTKDLKKMVDKIYNYIQNNETVLIEKYGRKGRYKDNVKDFKRLKRKQQESGKISAKINADKTKHITIEAIKKLLNSEEKITIKSICLKSGVSNKTVIKYYQGFRNEIKEHNLEVKNCRKEIDLEDLGI